jgi:uroporphyrinogen decarboxylase
MNSRERVLTALNHREPDRIPVDFSGHRSSGIAAIAYGRLRKHLGLAEKPIRVYDLIQQLAIVDEDVLARFRIDTTELGRAFAHEETNWADWELPDGTPCQVPAWSMPERLEGRWVLRSKTGRIIAHMPEGALYFEQIHYPFAEDAADFAGIPAAFDQSMWHAIAAPPGPLITGPDGSRTHAEGARRLRESTDRAILALFGGNLLETGQMLFRNDNFLMMLVAEPARAHDFLDRLVEVHLENLGRFLSDVGAYIDIIVFGDDLGMQTGPQISPRTYREFFKPRHAQMWQRARELADVRVMLHCCGGVRELMPDLIDAGLDAINPVQISCRGMEAAALKRDFGRDMVFWGGGADTQSMLPRGTPAKVKEHVRGQVKVLSPGGGFVFQQVHNIMANVPPENIVAMFDAVQE